MRQGSADTVWSDADIQESNVKQEEELGQEGPKTKPRRRLAIEQSRGQEVGQSEKSRDAAVPADACLDQRSWDQAIEEDHG
jgi:hypothetical protein